ncbi:MAG: RCC1 domain-containing protein, partial [Treponema sp.]|nr:RCC1 domain-containing protein [Treponema sp.]
RRLAKSRVGEIWRGWQCCDAKASVDESHDHPEPTGIFASRLSAVVYLVITTSGELWAWGSNGGGRLGDGTAVRRHSPVRIRITP